MLLDLGFVLENLGVVSAVVAGLFALKFIAAAGPTALAGMPIRVVLTTGLALAQIGEFSFVLALSGRSAGLMTQAQYQTFLAAAVATMALTPFAIAAAAGQSPGRVPAGQPLDQGQPTGRRADRRPPPGPRHHRRVRVQRPEPGRSLARPGHPVCHPGDEPRDGPHPAGGGRIDAVRRLHPAAGPAPRRHRPRPGIRPGDLGPDVDPAVDPVGPEDEPERPGDRANALPE